MSLQRMYLLTIMATNTQPEYAIKVFYDGGCSLCRREIHHYQRTKKLAAIDWIDITNGEAEVECYQLTRDQAMARFHVLDALGCWQVGAYGFVEMWSRLAGWRWLAFVLKKLRLLPLADRIYGWFARWRLQTRCSDATACDSKKGPRLPVQLRRLIR